MFNKKIVVCMCLLLFIITLSSTNVHAQSTNIIELVNPIHVPITSQNPILVSANVSYAGAGQNYTLIVGLLDQDVTPPVPVSAIATASPYPCVNQPSLNPLCAIRLQNASGYESLQIKVGGILGNHSIQGAWNLALSVVLLDANNNPVENSRSSVPFQIFFTPTPLLFVKVPFSVSVSVDGIAQLPGPIDGAPLTVGQHSLSVPTLVNVSDTARLRFDHWSDGSLSPTRSVYAQSDVGLEAFYVTQHSLMLNSSIGVTSGAGWYDSNSTATFSVSPNSAPLPGMMGMLGARLTVQGWYENGSLITSSSTGTISMDQAHTLVASWQPDYTIPEAVTVVIAIIIVAIGYITLKKRSPSKKPKSS
ncbi:MAG TPA: hypothetical protein VE862_08405 [Candidatus Acidoferrum sp.]|nr:hypothetical protein [Candidatus Acidoferrum sp.]